MVELLAVVVVITILVAMLLPALVLARDQGCRAVCMSNQRQLYGALLLYAADHDRWSPTTRWYASYMAGNFNNGIDYPSANTSLHQWLKEYCEILVVTDQSNYVSIRTLDHHPAGDSILMCPSANLRQECGPWLWSAWWTVSGSWQSLPASNYYKYKYQYYSYLLMGLGKAGMENWPTASPTGLETVQEWGSTRPQQMDGEGHPIAMFHERYFAGGTGLYNSHMDRGINVTDETGMVRWIKGSEIPAFGSYGGWAYNEYWIPPFWGAVSAPGAYNGPAGYANMNWEFGYKKD